MLWCLNHVANRRDKTVRRGAQVKALAICSRFQFIHVWTPPPTLTRTLTLSLSRTLTLSLSLTLTLTVIKLSGSSHLVIVASP